MSTPSLAVALVCLISLGAGGSPPSSAHDHGDLHESAARRVSFDESIGASASSPIVEGLAEAAADKRERDEAIPRQSQNPQVQLMPGARVNAGEDDGFELQATITQGWSLSGYGQARRTAAATETEVIAADARARALEQRLGAADAWVRLHAAERRLALAREDLELTRELAATVELAREAGVATRAEVAEAEVIEAEAEAAVVELAGEVHDLGLALARETGIARETGLSPVATVGDYPDPELPEDAEIRRRFAELERLPAVELRRLAARTALAEAEESERSRGTVLSTGASVQLESTGEVVLFGLVGTNIPVVDRNQRQQATARATARRSEAEAEQLVVELSATLGIALHELTHARERVELLRDRTLPALDELVAARAAAVELGEGTRAELLAAEHRRSVVARELAAAEGELVWARVRVWLYLEALAPEGSA